MKDIFFEIEDLLENGYDDEDIAMIVGVDIAIVLQAKDCLGILPNTSPDDLENY
jgi:hypothetical protein